jgi:aspartate racemase
MKLIGVLGGTSWSSTILPYRLLNLEVERRRGGYHSARIVLYSIDYHPIRSAYAADWGEIPALLRAEIETLLHFAPDCWMIANNTLHKIYDEIAQQIGDERPMFHAIRLVRAALLSHGVKHALLLGTRFTMEDGYYADPLRSAGISVSVPEKAERERIGAIQTELANGVIKPEFASYFEQIISHHAARGCEAVILGCTEFPLVITDDRSTLPIFDPLVLQCRACVDFALAP